MAVTKAGDECSRDQTISDLLNSLLANEERMRVAFVHSKEVFNTANRMAEADREWRDVSECKLRIGMWHFIRRTYLNGLPSGDAALAEWTANGWRHIWGKPISYRERWAASIEVFANEVDLKGRGDVAT